MEFAESILGYVVTVIEMISAAILLIGFMKGGYRFIRSELHSADPGDKFNAFSSVRFELGSYILLGLDFYIVSDIIHSMIKPQLHALINLALIVVLRTTIGFFLGKEISEIERRTFSQIRDERK